MKILDVKNILINYIKNLHTGRTIALQYASSSGWKDELTF
jgi:hypothetical protein